MPCDEYVYALLRGADDWTRVTSGDPSVWSYDRRGALPVDPDVLVSRAATRVWTEAGWDVPPRGYPALAVRVLRQPEPERVEEASSGATDTPPVAKEKRRRGRSGWRKIPNAQGNVALNTLRVAPEVPEQIDCLCEAYRMNPGQVITRLVQDAYRRDVVESGLIAILSGADIEAPVP